MNRLGSTARRTLLAAALLFAANIPFHGAAWADETILRLSETATVMVTPDELVASLRAEAVAPTAQDAQKRVNEMMRDAIVEAKQTAGIAVSTGGYNVWRIGPSPADRVERWQAGQSLNLSGKDAEAMLKLVGDLQQKGFAQGNLGWRLSRETERSARRRKPPNRRCPACADGLTKRPTFWVCGSTRSRKCGSTAWRRRRSCRARP